MSIFATVEIASNESHCVSVINATKFNATVYLSPNSNALLKPNKKIKKNIILSTISTDSYFIYLIICISNLNFLYCFTVTISI